MSLFKKIKMQGNYWGVFICSNLNEQDRYIVTSTLTNEKDADFLSAEFNKLADSYYQGGYA